MTDDRISDLVNAAADRVGGQLRQELTALAAGLRAYAAEQSAAAARGARADAEAAAAALASEAITAERAAAAERLEAARAEARETALTAARAAERESDLARADRLLASIRALDAAGSLTETLDALAAAAEREVARAAVLLVKGADVRGWAHRGFDAALPEARALQIPGEDAGIFGEAIRSGASVSTSGSRAGLPPPFVLDTDVRQGVAVPVVVDGRVVALVYADDGGGSDPEVPSAWPERVEVLARHASRCLEALTARQFIGGGARQGSADPAYDDESARRFARLLVSEIKLYHEPLVDEGRRHRDLRARLGQQITRARRLYDERVPAAIRTREDFFEQELVRTLAGGDGALLGQAT